MNTNVKLFRDPHPGFEKFRTLFITYPRDPEFLDVVSFNATEDDIQDGTVSLYELYMACRWIERRLGSPDSRQKISVSPYAPHLYI